MISFWDDIQYTGLNYSEIQTNSFIFVGQLVDVKGKILIPGVYDDVLPVTEQEKELYRNLEFNIDEMQADTGVKQLLHDTKARYTQLSQKLYIVHKILH